MAELLNEDEIRRWQTLEDQRTFERSGRAAYCPRCSAMCLEADDGSNCAQCPRQVSHTPRPWKLVHHTSHAVVSLRLVSLRQHSGLSSPSLCRKPVLRTLWVLPQSLRGALQLDTHALLLLLTLPALLVPLSTSQPCHQSLPPLICGGLCNQAQLHVWAGPALPFANLSGLPASCLTALPVPQGATCLICNWVQVLLCLLHTVPGFMAPSFAAMPVA